MVTFEPSVISSVDPLLFIHGFFSDEDMDDDDDEGVSQELLIDRSVLDDLRNEVQKLLTWKKLTSVGVIVRHSLNVLCLFSWTLRR